MKKLVALIISSSLVLVPCFAYADTATGSSIQFDDTVWVYQAGGVKPIEVAAVESGAIKAAGDPGTSTNPYYFLTPGRNATVYYAANSTSASSNSYYVDDLADVVQGISQSIAYSVQNQRNLWSTIGSNTVSAINDVYNRIGTLNGYVDGLESAMLTNNTRLGTIDTAVGNIKSKLDSVYTSVDNLEGYTDDIEGTLSSILTAIQNQSFTVPQSLLDDVDSIESYSSTNNSRWSWNSSFNSSMTLRRYMQNGEGGSASDLSLNPTNRSIPNQIWYYLSSLNNSFVLASRDLLSGVSVNNTQTYLDKDLNPISMGRTSFWRDFRNIGGNINNLVARLAFVLANDDEIAARQAAAANTAAAVSNVISLSGSGSAKPTDISGVADLKSSTVDSISSGVSAGTVFSQTGSGGHAWDWFTQDIADELSAPSGRSYVRSNSKSSGSDTPYLDAYYHDLEEAIGFKLTW